ncbi:Saccharopine dehydrogenase, putative [Babesia ovis]|uniref:Saccharopine dehydrogenase, putative n=1 Tax=Babesia ovis TaxID=5869 RepID=A0A9W5WWB6_BABOV|nr:Saccharopine dehydrogenase, putative [Babesia ovis]
MDEINSYRNRHHKAYLERKGAAVQSATSGTADTEPALGNPTVVEPPVTEPLAHNVEEYIDDLNIKAVGSLDAMEQHGDPLYESSVALARSLQEELNAPSARGEHTRDPDEVYQERIMPSEAEDAELQAAIAQSLIEM